ncbi:MAG: prepilin-type N-terminal cleavage/methylation domain-containing protein [Deltaproteobacteria bacterium]|nr:prepilin-type N-terminal cleavage/methylation domain-containing protein [Deltaproteobacteria bacterium]
MTVFINSKGFTLIGLAVIIAIMSIVLMTASRVYSTMVKRDMEEDLLFRGDGIKDAIDS